MNKPSLGCVAPLALLLSVQAICLAAEPDKEWIYTLDGKVVHYADETGVTLADATDAARRLEKVVGTGERDQWKHGSAVSPCLPFAARDAEALLPQVLHQVVQRLIDHAVLDAVHKAFLADTDVAQDADRDIGAALERYTQANAKYRQEFARCIYAVMAEGRAPGAVYGEHALLREMYSADEWDGIIARQPKDGLPGSKCLSLLTFPLYSDAEGRATPWFHRDCGFYLFSVQLRRYVQAHKERFIERLDWDDGQIQYLDICTGSGEDVGEIQKIVDRIVEKDGTVARGALQAVTQTLSGLGASTTLSLGSTSRSMLAHRLGIDAQRLVPDALVPVPPAAGEATGKLHYVVVCTKRPVAEHTDGSTDPERNGFLRDLAFREVLQTYLPDVLKRFQIPDGFDIPSAVQLRGLLNILPQTSNGHAPLPPVPAK